MLMIRIALNPNNRTRNQMMTTIRNQTRIRNLCAAPAITIPPPCPPTQATPATPRRTTRALGIVRPASLNRTRTTCPWFPLASSRPPRMASSKQDLTAKNRPLPRRPRQSIANEGTSNERGTHVESEGARRDGGATRRGASQAEARPPPPRAPAPLDAHRDEIPSVGAPRVAESSAGRPAAGTSNRRSLTTNRTHRRRPPPLAARRSTCWRHQNRPRAYPQSRSALCATKRTKIVVSYKSHKRRSLTREAIKIIIINETRH